MPTVYPAPSSAIASQVNVPGQLLHYDGARNRVITSELSRVVVEDVTAEACYARFAHAEFVTPNGNRDAPVASP